MEGISKGLLKELHTIAVLIGDLVRAHVLNDLIRECKELPGPQWQTIEEFKANPVEGWCFVCFSGCSREMAYYFKDAKEFHDRDDSGYSYAERNITHVMPIKTPEAPK